MTTSNLATRPANALAPQQTRMGGLIGEEQDDVLMPRAHIFQGLPLERERYGKHDEGTLVNSITGEEIGIAGAMPKFVPIFGFKEWVRTEKVGNQNQLVYRTRSKSEVPAADLEWNTDPSGARSKPAAMESINFVCLFEGQDYPLVLRFQSTSLSAGKTLNTLEKMRGAKGSGLYALELKKKTNTQGSWLTPSIRASGNPSPEMMDLAKSMFEALSGLEIVVEETAAEAAEPADADIPI